MHIACYWVDCTRYITQSQKSKKKQYQSNDSLAMMFVSEIQDMYKMIARLILQGQQSSFFSLITIQLGDLKKTKLMDFEICNHITQLYPIDKWNI